MLVHDSYSSVDDAAAAEIFTKIQNAFDSTFCHFLQVNKIMIFLCENKVSFSHFNTIT